MELKENQKIEFKESWRDDHLRGICAFANSKGGTFYIGKNDSGQVVGVTNSKKLLEDIPSTIINHLGIVAEVNAKKEKGGDIIIIKIKPAKAPVTYKGKWYIRSGSTTRELNGSALSAFLLEKHNISWEAIIEEQATIKDLNSHTINKFRERCKSSAPAIANETSVIRLLEKLHLLKGQKLTRAAILLFGKDPQKFYPAAAVKIARLKDDNIIVNMDEVKGNLFEQSNEIIEILKNKYLNADVRIEGLYREAELEIPEPALREAMVNAIVHRDYSEAETQIKVYPDFISIWNFGPLNDNLTIEKLKRKHPSFPRNSLVADVFFKAGLIEKWGSGTLKIVSECNKAGLPDPVFEEDAGGFQLSLLKNNLNSENFKRWGLSERQIKAVMHVKEFGKITNGEFQTLANISKRTATSDLQSLLKKGVLTKLGATGKGTQYVLSRGNKGAIGATLTKTATTDELDARIGSLMSELDKISPDDEVRWHLNKDVFFKIFDLWLSEFLLRVIPIGQKFNPLFTDPKHHINVLNGIGGVSFTNEKPSEVIDKLIGNCRQFNQNIYDATINIQFYYGTFRKAGLKTFGCNYSIEIKLEHTRYKIALDQFTDGNTRNKVQQLENLLHKRVTTQQIKSMCKQFGESIFEHIDFSTKKEGLR